MIVLDENFIASQCEALLRHGVHFRRIGDHLGHRGMDDRNDILPILHHLPRPTFLSCDAGFYRRQICHPGYCLVVLDVGPLDLAAYARRFLHHPEFRTAAQRMGCVAHVSFTGISYWRRNVPEEQRVPWPD